MIFLILIHVSLCSSSACLPGSYLKCISSENNDNNSLSNYNHTSCISCGKGFYCPHYNMTAPLPCPLGEYTVHDNSTACQICPAGSYCNQTNSLPVPCPNGYYSLKRTSLCLSCPAGYRWTLFNVVLLKRMKCIVYGFTWLWQIKYLLCITSSTKSYIFIFLFSMQRYIVFSFNETLFEYESNV